MPIIGSGPGGGNPATISDRIAAVNGPDIFRGEVDPNGVVAANRVGDIYFRRTTGVSPKERIYYCYQTDGTPENSGWTESEKDTAPLVYSWQYEGNVALGTLPFPHYIREYDMMAVRVALSVATAPTGADLIVDIKKNGVANSMFTTAGARPRILAGQLFSETTVIAEPGLGKGGYIVPEIVQIGSGVSGANLGIHIWTKVA